MSAPLSGPVRLFFAIRIAAPRPLAYLLQTLSTWRSQLRLTAAEQLHLTLRFLGDMPEARVQQLSAALDEAVVEAQVRAFDWPLRGY